ncbi:MAG: hypothetical protein P4L69_14045 [Desulfosporosinus sp.]|nr:hypothetical protein [Desulfosporosinus sp.]
MDWNEKNINYQDNSLMIPLDKIWAVEELKTVGLLHHIGKIAIDDSILNKPEMLTDDEWEEIRCH